MSLTTWVLVSVLAVGQAPPAASPSAPPANGTPAAPQAADPAALPVSIDRIREALSHQPTIRPDAVQPVFRVEVIGTMPSIEEMLGKDFWKGGTTPTPGGAMTHQEIMAMMTPPEYRGAGVFTGGEALTVMATSAALQWALQKAVAKYKEARDARAQDEARREVLSALEALDKARAAAGLPKR